MNPNHLVDLELAKWLVKRLRVQYCAPNMSSVSEVREDSAGDCCVDVTNVLNPRSTIKRNEGICMFDVYLNGRNDLLVVPHGFSVPEDLSGNWRKRKRAVRSVSDTIR